MKFKFILYAPHWLAMLLLMSVTGLNPTGGIASENISRNAEAQIPLTQSVDIEVFVREGCPHCAKAEAFLATLMQQRAELKVVIHDVLKEPAALERLQYIVNSQPGAVARVPTFIIHGQLITGYSEEANTARLIMDSLDSTVASNIDNTNAANRCDAETRIPCETVTLTPPIKSEYFAFNFMGHRLALDQVGLPAFTVAMGLLDGFNPCSMWVLILMISLLAQMNSRPRMLAIGSTFVAVQGLAYFIFMAAWLNLFLLIGLSRISEIIIAILALVAGAINLKDFWRYGWGMTLSIPASTKPGIYARLRRILEARSLAAAIFGVIMLAILVQIVELMCTSGLPALYTRILTLQQLSSLSYYSYLALYDLAYMLDDVIVLSIGVITLSQRRLQEREGRWLKLLSGLVMLGLGLYLLLFSS